MGKKEYIFIERWKKENRKILMQLHPEVDKKDIDKFLDKQIKKNLNNPKCLIDNNYIGKCVHTNLLDVCNFVENEKPICAGYGVFYKNQHEVTNALALMIQKFLKSRKAYKSMLRKFPKTSYEYSTYDRKQLSEKICANSVYGTFGNVISFLFNMYTAPSVTSTGQSLISTTEQAFEAFLVNNVLFNNIDECMTYLRNILKEKHTMDDNFLKDVSEEQLCSKLFDMFYNLKDSYIPIVEKFISTLTQSQINRIYYKNNIYEFSMHIEIRSILSTIVRNTESFKDPNDIPESSQKYLELLFKYYDEFVLYNYSPINRIQRLKNDKRKCVLTIDTDSNFLNLNPWVEFMFDNIITPDYRCDNRDPESLRFISINIMAYVITQMIRKVLNKYTETANVPKDYREFINIKNEFLMSRVVLASKKKKYISSIRLREGDEIYPEKVDIKGFEFMKSTATEQTKDRFTHILKTRILEPKNIDITLILDDMIKFENDIINSLKNGEKTYVIPKSVKELEAYADNGLREQGVRAIIAWNYIYPDMEIELPAKIDMVKLTLDDERNLEKLKYVDKRVYDVVKEKIYNNPDERISKKGFPVIAIPRNIDKIPEWIIPFIDYDTISYNILSKFYPLLESLGLSTIKTSKKEYFSNILNI